MTLIGQATKLMESHAQLHTAPLTQLYPAASPHAATPKLAHDCQHAANSQICAVVTTNAFAEFAIVPEVAALKLPPRADLETSAGLPVAFGTAHVALAHRASLKAGQTVLILGAAGGVGMAAVQVCSCPLFTST